MRCTGRSAVWLWQQMARVLGGALGKNEMDQTLITKPVTSEKPRRQISGRFNWLFLAIVVLPTVIAASIMGRSRPTCMCQSHNSLSEAQTNQLLPALAYY
jgi:hypothetical protein